jgi:tetratricopeptide (TPR) repeat protein
MLRGSGVDRSAASGLARCCGARRLCATARYNLIVARGSLGFFRAVLAGLSLAFALTAQQPPKPAPEPVEPPEEDESLAVKEYAFNPLQAEKELKTGDFYFKKGSHKAAAARYLEATKWDPSSALAHFKLAEALEKLGDKDGARKAYAKVVELDSEGKLSGRAKKKLPPKS